MPNPWNGKAVLEAFWWNCFNNRYRFDWYTHIAKLAPSLAAMGFDGIWTPPPCKDTDAHNNMGYTPFDYYDIGNKFQMGATETRFGNQDSFLRMIAVAHANGLEVYPDIVLDHSSGAPGDGHGGSSKVYQPAGFAAIGRWARSPEDFHANSVHTNGSGDWPAAPFGDDFCYRGRCSDSGNADPNCYNRIQARAWFTWFVRQTGVDGFRFDDVKGYPPEVVEDLLFNAMGDRRDFFCVGEYVTGNPNECDQWATDCLNRSGTFDYPFRDALVEMVYSNGFYDLGSLPGLQQKNRFKTVPFINNHDVYQGVFWDSSDANASDHTGIAQNKDEHTGGTLDPDNPRTPLAYAIAMTVDGSPQLFYDDLFVNFRPQRNDTKVEDLPTRPYIQNLLWCHQKLEFKAGDYFVRYQGSRELLILERGRRAIVAINNDGVNWHDQWVSTAFEPNTQLQDYSGSRPDHIFTNQDGWAHIAVPPCSYSVWGPVGIGGDFAPAPRRTTQQFEMDDDLGDANPLSLGYGGKAIPAIFRTAGAIWPAQGSQVHIEIYADSLQHVDFILQPNALTPPTLTSGTLSGTAAPNAPLAITFTIQQEGLHHLTARLSNPADSPARLYLKADYIGPTHLNVP